MIKFLGKDPSDATIKWSEDKIQMYIVQEARRAGYTVMANMERGKRSKATGARDKAMGMTAGRPDMTFYRGDNIVTEIELKVMNGRLNDAQKKLHGDMKHINHDIKTVFATCPQDGYDQVLDILVGRLWT